MIDIEQVENVPLNGRAYTELLTLIPGAIVTNPDQFGVLISLSATNQVVNGHRSNQNNLTVDGVGNLDGGSNGSLINNVSPDFLQEVKIQSSNFSSEYGRSTGAAFNIMTKNGTNNYHGGAFEYFRNDVLDARNFFSIGKTELRYNDFGWSLGGPIAKTSAASTTASMTSTPCTAAGSTTTIRSTSPPVPAVRFPSLLSFATALVRAR